MSRSGGHFIWYELMTPDADAAAVFYGAVVGWQIAATANVEPGTRDYRMIVRDDGGNAGGVLQLTREMCAAGAAPMWIPYLQVEDVEATLRAIAQEGGAVQMPPVDLPVGRIAMVTDPQGIPIYLMDPIPPVDAPDAVSDVFAPAKVQHVSWNELASPDLEASRSFYSRHFGFEFNESTSLGGKGEYCYVDHDGRRLGAMLQHQNGQDAAWLMYFRVPSIDTASERIEQLGGRVLQSSRAVPWGERVLIGRDPQGATFGLVGPGR